MSDNHFTKRSFNLTVLSDCGPESKEMFMRFLEECGLDFERFYGDGETQVLVVNNLAGALGEAVDRQ